jgi:hypothetical protein
MRFRILPKILLIVGFLAIFVILKYQNAIKESWLFNLQRAKVTVENFSNPEIIRHRPMTLLQNETELKLYIGQPFLDFSRKDWADFWNLLYGTFPKEPAGEGLPRRVRQLTEDEIAFELMDRYPQPFAYFQKNHWQTFFSIAFKKR